MGVHVRTVGTSLSNDRYESKESYVSSCLVAAASCTYPRKGWMENVAAKDPYITVRDRNRQTFVLWP